MEEELLPYIPRRLRKTQFKKENTDFLAKFYTYLFAEKNSSEHTIRAYITDLLEFFVFLEREDVSVLKVKTTFLRSYFTERTGARFRGGVQDQRNITGSKAGRKLNPRSQARKLAVIRSFFKFLRMRDIIPENPAENIPMPRYFRGLPGNIRGSEMDQLLEEGRTPAENVDLPETPSRAALRLRDVCIYEMLYTSGMRISELLRLVVADVEDGNDVLRVLGKGDKERIVFLGKEARDAIIAYLDVRAVLVPKTSSLFVNHRGATLNDRGVRYRMREHARRLGLNKNLYPHRFRHSFATDLLNAGADIRTVQEMLGHSSLSTTQSYTRVTKDKLREVYWNCHPSARIAKSDGGEELE